jgi:cytoskeletal protein CcmA (bactofilin family)
MGQTAPAKQTLIEDDTEFKGVLASKCPIVVKGTVEGEITGPSLHVSSSGSVSGKIKVSELRSEGVLAGTFDAESVHLAGTVKNETVIRARTLEVRLAPQNGKLQVTFGECELAVGDMPSKEDAVASASGSTVAAAAAAAAAAAPTGKKAEADGKKGDADGEKDKDGAEARADEGEGGNARGGGRSRRHSSSPASV